MKEIKTEILQQLKKLSLEEVAGVIQTLEEKCANATLAKHETLPEGDNYALFIWRPNLPPMRSMMDIMFTIPEQGEDWKENKKTYGKTLIFVKMSKDVKELSSIIRREPSYEYVIMKGGMMKVSAITQIFVDGKNTDTLESEWS